MSELRAFVLIDRMQPRYAAYTGATVQGDLPLAGMAQLVAEIAPGNEVFRIVDAALKAARVRPSSQIVEREFGFLAIHSADRTEVDMAARAILDRLGMSIGDRTKPRVESSQIITSVEPYQAQLLNKWRSGSLVIPGQTLFVFEVSPAAYVTLAANEAEKNATFDLVQVNAVGRFGRMIAAGTEADIRHAAEVAAAAIDAVDGREP